MNSLLRIILVISVVSAFSCDANGYAEYLKQYPYNSKCDGVENSESCVDFNKEHENTFIAQCKKLRWRRLSGALLHNETIFMDWSDDELDELGELNVKYSQHPSYYDAVDINEPFFTIPKEPRDFCAGKEKYSRSNTKCSLSWATTLVQVAEAALGGKVELSVDQLIKCVPASELYNGGFENECGGYHPKSLQNYLLDVGLATKEGFESIKGMCDDLEKIETYRFVSNAADPPNASGLMNLVAEGKLVFSMLAIDLPKLRFTKDMSGIDEPRSCGYYDPTVYAAVTGYKYEEDSIESSYWQITTHVVPCEEIIVRIPMTSNMTDANYAGIAAYAFNLELAEGPTTEVPVVTTEPPVVTTEPPVVTTEPPVVTTEPPVVTTEPPVVTTEPPVVTTEPPVVTTEPPVVTTEPPVVTTEPPVPTTEPPTTPVPTTEPPTTEPPTTEPPTTEPPTTEPPTTEPPTPHPPTEDIHIRNRGSCYERLYVDEDAKYTKSIKIEGDACTEESMKDFVLADFPYLEEFALVDTDGRLPQKRSFQYARSATFKNLPALKSIHIHDYGFQEAELIEFENLPNLTDISFGSTTFTKTNNLTLYDLPELTTVTISDGSFNPDTSVFIAKELPKLSVLYFSQNAFINADTLVLEGLDNLDSLTFYGSNFQRVANPVIEGLPMLTYLAIDFESFKYSTTLKISKLDKLETLLFPTDAINSVVTLTLNDLPELKTLEVGKKSLKAVTDIYIYDVPFTSGTYTLSTEDEPLSSLPADGIHADTVSNHLKECITGKGCPP